MPRDHGRPITERCHTLGALALVAVVFALPPATAAAGEVAPAGPIGPACVAAGTGATCVTTSGSCEALGTGASCTTSGPTCRAEGTGATCRSGDGSCSAAGTGAECWTSGTSCTAVGVGAACHTRDAVCLSLPTGLECVPHSLDSGEREPAVVELPPPPAPPPFPEGPPVVTETPEDPPATLDLNIRDLPAGERGRIVITGDDGFRLALRRSQQVALEPGMYRLAAAPVVLRRRHGRLAAGSLAYALGAAARFRLRAGETTRIVARYGTVLRPNVRALPSREVWPTYRRGAPRAVAVGRPVRRGQVLTARATRDLPHGLFARVVRVEVLRKGKGPPVWYAHVRPAALTDVFARLDAHDAVRLRALPTRRARAAAVGDVNVTASLPRGWSCGFDVNQAPRLDLQLGLRPDVRLELGLTGPSKGVFSVGIKGAMRMDLTVPQRLQCQRQVWRAYGPRTIGHIRVPGADRIPSWAARTPGTFLLKNLEIPVSVTVDAFLGGELNQPTRALIAGDMSVSAGVAWDGSARTPIGGTSFNITASELRGGGNVVGGGIFKLILGYPDKVGAFADLEVEHATRPDVQGGWRMDGEYSRNVGVEFFGNDISYRWNAGSLYSLRGINKDTPGAPGPTAGEPSGGAAPAASPASGPAPGEASRHYDCPNDNSNIGHYVPAGRFWTQEFVARGSSITGGRLQLGANDDGGDHRARIGIYGGFGLERPLRITEVAVSGYDGEEFRFEQPLAVTPGERYYLTASGIGDFTAYDNRTSCFIGRLDGA